LRLGSPTADEPVHVEAYVLDDYGAIINRRGEARVLGSALLQRPDGRYFDLDFASRTGHLGAPVLDANGALLGLLEPGLDPVSVAQVIAPPPEELTFALRARLALVLFQINGFALDSVAGPVANAAPDATPDAVPSAAPAASDDSPGQAVVGVECWALREATNNAPSPQHRDQSRSGGDQRVDRTEPAPASADPEPDPLAATRP
jgi:hypothetical protein